MGKTTPLPLKYLKFTCCRLLQKLLKLQILCWIQFRYLLTNFIRILTDTAASTPLAPGASGGRRVGNPYTVPGRRWVARDHRSRLVTKTIWLKTGSACSQPHYNLHHDHAISETEMLWRLRSLGPGSSYKVIDLGFEQLLEGYFRVSAVWPALTVFGGARGSHNMWQCHTLGLC